MCFIWREGSFPAAGREMLLSAELVAVTEGLQLLSFISRLGSWPCSCNPFARSDSCCPLWIVRNWAKAISLFLVLELRLWRGSRAFPGQLFLRACCARSCSPTSPDLGTAQVSSPSQQTLHCPSQGGGGCGQPNGSWIQPLVLPVLAGNTWWK